MESSLITLHVQNLSPRKLIGQNIKYLLSMYLAASI